MLQTYSEFFKNNFLLLFINHTVFKHDSVCQAVRNSCLKTMIILAVQCETVQRLHLCLTDVGCIAVSIRTNFDGHSAVVE